MSLDDSIVTFLRGDDFVCCKNVLQVLGGACKWDEI